MMQTWFQQYLERRAAIRRKQQEHLTAQQSERYAQEARGEMQDLVQVRRRERQREEENGGVFEVTEDEAMEDQDIRWPKGSHRHPFQRVADLSLRIAGRNEGLRYRLFKFLGEEAEKGTCAAAIYEAVWEAVNHLADDVLDEAIGVVYEEHTAVLPAAQRTIAAPMDERKAKAANAA